MTRLILHDATHELCIHGVLVPFFVGIWKNYIKSIDWEIVGAHGPLVHDVIRIILIVKTRIK